MKVKRQEKILEIISKYSIETQEELIDRLFDAGYEVTQATASRDIRELKLVKGMTGKGEYKYILPGVKKENNVPVMNEALADSVIRVEAAGNIVVVQTYPGMANALAVCVYSLEKPHIVGSVAGDDTILLVVRTNEIATEVAKELKVAFRV